MALRPHLRWPMVGPDLVGLEWTTSKAGIGEYNFVSVVNGVSRLFGEVVEVGL